MSQGAAASSESSCAKDGEMSQYCILNNIALQKHLNISKLDSITNAGD